MGFDLEPLAHLLGRVAAVLDVAGVRYAVVGGVAVNLVGEIRETKDLDCTLALEESGISGVAQAFEKAGFVVGHYGGPGAPMARWMRLTQPSADPPIRTDLIVATDGLWKNVVARARPLPIGDGAYPVATPEDLILLKLKAGRLQDLFDAASVIKVQRLRKAPLDTAYLDGEATRWGVGGPWRKLREAMKE